MADKKYYWLKLQKDFFKRHDIRIIENMSNGKDYILFYLKLLVESVSHNGELRFSETIPYNEEMLSTITSTNIDIVRSAMKVFTELEMIEVLDDSTIFMTEVNTMMGSETDEHIREQGRIRQQRYRENQKALRNVTVTLHRNAELELDIDKDNNNTVNNNKNIYSDAIAEIISYLNQKTDSSYTTKNKTNNSYINARLTEGHTVDEFKIVIDKMVDKWGSDSKMSQYLRPQTLFGNKFESYLNMKNVPTEQNQKDSWLKMWEDA